jgi:hypothetical protein
MTGDKHVVYDDASDVSAVDGAVELDGPDAVDVAMTPEAAEETSERLTDQAVKARGQRRMRNYPHRGEDG